MIRFGIKIDASCLSGSRDFSFVLQREENIDIYCDKEVCRYFGGVADSL